MRGEGARGLVLGERHLDQVAAGRLPGGARHPPVDPHAARGDEARGLSSGETQLIGEKAVQALGPGTGDGEGDGGQGPAQAEEAASRLARRASSSQSETARAIAPQLTPMSATLKVGQRCGPIPTSMKSTTPCAVRIRSTRFPAAPPATRPQESWRSRSPAGLERESR